LFPDGDRIVISARSIGETNVQVIMEKLGGGGNSATAGAQLTGVTLDEAAKRLIAAIDQYFEDE
ncbi:MAG TPA: DHHA1 domain-containing protein, partial [Armatimonadota bacterium]|nr:DHHA1 domain-containing protein [Armatimonadota bacterium]